MTPEDEREALLPCPFCGHAAYPSDDLDTMRKAGERTGWEFAVMCSWCEVTGEPGTAPEIAVANWNTRAGYTRGSSAAMREAVRLAGNAHLETLPHLSPEWAVAELMHGACLAAFDALPAPEPVAAPVVTEDFVRRVAHGLFADEDGDRPDGMDFRNVREAIEAALREAGR